MDELRAEILAATAAFRAHLVREQEREEEHLRRAELEGQPLDPEVLFETRPTTIDLN